MKAGLLLLSIVIGSIGGFGLAQLPPIYFLITIITICILIIVFVIKKRIDSDKNDSQNLTKKE